MIERYKNTKTKNVIIATADFIENLPDADDWEKDIITPATKTFDEIKQEKLKEIKNKFQQFINSIKSQYAPYEIESFQDQREEWREWVKDNSTPTPIVDALAQARGIDRVELLNRIGQKVVQIISIQGLQNKLEDQVNAAQTIDEVEAIDVDAVLGGLQE
ncbi:hypothetical protein NrS5_53 [Nitratiruptor phage NrS-5]|uniref:hypothetical protein n=1 Tax=unclassified Nitratiruptor TaxID=2624044 RepID=UPI0019169FA4|nr:MULTISPECIES: hypothetical protein [unclassified Nitratiruptor]BCD61757.1 hypothetical protein NitYY0813_C0617 [Nitratiruptor sp. YY08-13]BCD65692.1 hypothetical protein NitYY0826_C0619 [Nitratiruptor sp. YY08-26]BCD83235.1 hypothetical protein NrS4_53 [Nitratiruptor phage NrS-4]BCD83294.1 hypothetical protein NrS5_53 [Nitratiruptor phage NrS-5]